MLNLYVDGWHIWTDEDKGQQYVFLERDDKPGVISVKLDDEGFVIDAIRNDGRVEDGTWFLYSELDAEGA